MNKADIKKLREMIAKSGIKKGELAKRADISPNTLREVLKEYREPRRSTLRAICAVLEVDAVEINVKKAS